MTQEHYTYWRAVAGRYGRCDGDGGDLLHEAALAVGGLPTVTEGEEARVFVGVLRTLAKQTRRADTRRLGREGRFASAQENTAPAASSDPGVKPLPGAASLPSLTDDQRVLLALLASDYDRAEAAFLLGVSPAALRQRIATLRRRLAGMLSEARDSAAQEGVERLAARRSVTEARLRARAIALARTRGSLCALDPDGHPVSLHSNLMAGPHHAFPSGDHRGENTAP